MLVLSRKLGEEIVMPQSGVTIKVVAVQGNRVKLAFAAPQDVGIFRREILAHFPSGQGPPPPVEVQSEGNFQHA